MLTVSFRKMERPVVKKGKRYFRLWNPVEGEFEDQRGNFLPPTVRIVPDIDAPKWPKGNFIPLEVSKAPIFYRRCVKTVIFNSRRGKTYTIMCKSV